MSNPEQPFTGDELIAALSAAQKRVDSGEDLAPPYEEADMHFRDGTIGTQEA